MRTMFQSRFQNSSSTQDFAKTSICVEFENLDRSLVKKISICIFTFPHDPTVHWGHGSRSHGADVGGFVLASQLTSLSLHSTERVIIPEPQVTEHLTGKRTKNSVLMKDIKQTIKHHRQWVVLVSIYYLTFPQSLIIQVGHGLMLQLCLDEGLFSRLHPRLDWPFSNLQVTFRCLVPLPQDIEHWKAKRRHHFKKAPHF